MKMMPSIPSLPPLANRRLKKPHDIKVKSFHSIYGFSGGFPITSPHPYRFPIPE